MDFHEGSLSMPDCLTQCIPRAYKLWLRGTCASSWATVGSTIRTKVYMPITQMHKWANTLSGPVVYGVGFYSSHRSTLVCGWMPNCCYWGGDISKGHLIRAFCWCHSSQHHLLRKLSFPHWIALASLLKINHKCKRLFLNFQNYSIELYVFMPVKVFDDCRFIKTF